MGEPSWLAFNHRTVLARRGPWERKRTEVGEVTVFPSWPLALHEREGLGLTVLRAWACFERMHAWCHRLAGW